MLAFHNDETIKQKYLARVRAHRAADELIRGTGFENGRGCAVGCTLDAYDHSRYPTELGIPEMLARLEDVIFEGLPLEQAMEWPERFLSAVKTGSNLSLVGWKFQHWLLTDSKIGSYDHPLIKDAVDQCARAIYPLTVGLPVDTSAASAAWSAARSAASAARSAASAAWSAARSAASAAWSAASAAWSAARSAAYSKMADKLIELIESAV